MSTDEARNLYARRKELSDPTFGIIKDQWGARRFLLRGLVNVRAEFSLITTAFNLKTLCQVWEKAHRAPHMRLNWLPMKISDPSPATAAELAS